MKLGTLIALASLGFASAKLQTSTDYGFSTVETKHGKTLRRQRRAQVNVDRAPADARPEAIVSEEDHAFWNRILDGHLMSIPQPTTPPPVPSTPAPTPCPVNVSLTNGQATHMFFLLPLTRRVVPLD